MVPLEVSVMTCGAGTRLSMMDLENGMQDNMTAKEACKFVTSAKLNESQV